jgi:transcriptional regulator with XRE-family HTH domain
MVILDAYGGNLREKRKEVGISQEELAQRSGLHRTVISDHERGRADPQLQSIAKLADALDTTVSELCDGIALRQPAVAD